MNYGDHNFIEITQQTKLRVAPVALVVSSVSSRAVRQCRHSQSAWARHVERVESCRVETWRAKWNLSLTLRTILLIYSANRYGDNTSLCLTPQSTSKNRETTEPHLIHVEHSLNQFSCMQSSIIQARGNHEVRPALGSGKYGCAPPPGVSQTGGSVSLQALDAV